MNGQIVQKKYGWILVPMNLKYLTSTETSFPGNKVMQYKDEGIFEVKDPDEIFGVVYDGSRRYKGVIPDDCYHEPYMPMDELLEEMKRMRFYGFRKDLKLLGVMAKEPIKDVTLIRHAYVSVGHQGKGIGSKLLAFIEKQVDTEWLLIGTWKAATWAIDFYKKHGYTLMDNKDDLLRKYWAISDRQIETSIVLGKKMKKIRR
jgi:GNAT superfamily N-acetyltransferase